MLFRSGLPDWGIKHTLLSHLRNPIKGIGCHKLGFPDGSVVKNPPTNAGDTGDLGSSSRSGKSPGEGNGNPLQCSFMGNPMDRGAWRATVHGVINCLQETHFRSKDIKRFRVKDGNRLSMQTIIKGSYSGYITRKNKLPEKINFKTKLLQETKNGII